MEKIVLVNDREFTLVFQDNTIDVKELKKLNLRGIIPEGKPRHLVVKDYKKIIEKLDEIGALEEDVSKVVAMNAAAFFVGVVLTYLII